MASLDIEFILQQLEITKEFDFAEINSLRDELAAIAKPNFLALEHQRLLGSNTLRRSEELESWQEANRKIFQWIASDEALTFAHLQSLNGGLHLAGGGKLREKSIFGDLGEFVDHKSLPLFAALLADRVLNAEICPLRKAAQVYQWISSFHPFADANGRTARLAADFVLIAAGYPPLSFENPFDAMVAIKSNSGEMDGNFGMTKLLKWLANSYRILLI